MWRVLHFLFSVLPDSREEVTGCSRSLVVDIVSFKAGKFNRETVEGERGANNANG